MKEQYETYTSNEIIKVPRRKLYTDVDGFPNELAFRDFCSKLDGNEGLILVCITFDLAVSNDNKGYSYGTMIMRKLYSQLKNTYYVFRFSGNKFNVLAKYSELNRLKQMCDTCPADYATIYYGIVEESIVTGENYTQLRKTGVERMYKFKANKTNKSYDEVREDVIVGEKGNTPSELQETDVHKFRETMWYGIIRFEEITPMPRSVKAYVYITEYKKFPASLNMIVVLDDMVYSRVFTGNNITVGFDGNKFDINSRIDDNGNFILQCFPDRDNKGQIEFHIDRHEGSCIPANFGKRVGEGLEVYPTRPNAYGSYDYVLWNDKTKTAELVTTGIVKINDIPYTVHMNNKGIDLIEMALG